MAKKSLFPGVFLVLAVFLSIDGWSQTVTETFDVNGTFVVPAGVTSITVECWGGGGAGGGNAANNTRGGGGGAGGAYARSVLSVSALQSYTVTVGIAQPGAQNAGAVGNFSWFGTAGTVFAQGGAGGGIPSGAGGVAGGVGSAGSSIGTVTIAGTSGANGTNTIGGAGGQGANGGGAGGPQLNNTEGDGNVGTSPGGGGGGAFIPDNSNHDGGDGAAGRVIVSYTLPASPRTYYSRQTGNWDATTTWSISSHTGGVATNVPIPSATDVVLIGANHTVTIPASINASAATLTVNDNATSGILSIGTNTDNPATLTVSGNITVNTSGTLQTAGDGGTTRTITVGGNISNSGTFNLTNSASPSTIIFNGSANRTISGSGTFATQNFTLNTTGSSNVIFDTSGNLSISGILTFSANGLLVTGTNSNVVLGQTASISGFNSNRYIQLDGASGTNSNLTKASGNNATDWDFIFPIGTATGGYTPLDLQSIGGVNPTAASTLSVKSIYSVGVSGMLRRTFRLTVAGNANLTTFSNGVFTYNNTTDIFAGDSESDYIGVWRLASGAFTNIATIAPPVNQFTVLGGTDASASLITGTYEYTIGENPTVWYSYQTGNYDNPDVWTLDPSGTTLDNPFTTTPDLFDEINILNGITVTVNVSNQTLSAATIEGGGTLDMGISTGQSLGTITGTGLLRVNGTTLPSGTYTSFVSVTGGTIEYYNTTGALSTTVTSYNHLKLTNSTASNIIFTLASNLTVNGTFDITTTSTGTATWLINNGTANRRTITLNGDLNVSGNGRIRASTSGVTGPHLLTIVGDLTNSGSIKFFDDTDLELEDADYTSGAIYTNALKTNAVNVTFSGPTAQLLSCTLTGQTDFYRLIMDKGTGQQAMLTIYSAATTNFRLFGPNNQDFSGPVPNYISDNNLSIVNGTLQLTGTITIPSLVVNGGGGIGGGWPIPENGALWINSPNVSVTSTNTTDTGDNGRQIYVFGSLRMSAGTLTTGYSRGILGGGSGSIRVEGGTINTWQLRTTYLGSNNRFAYIQSGGTVNIGTTGLTGVNVDQYPRFALPYAECSFIMSSGTINVANPLTGGITTDGGILIFAATSNILVTGGTVNAICPASGTNFRINTTAPFFNLNVSKAGAAGASTAILNSISFNDGTTFTPAAQPLTILNNLTIVTNNTPVLNCNALALTVAGNLDVQTGTTLTSGLNTITFNGAGAQTWTNNGTITANLNNVILNKSAGTLTLAGSVVFPDITGALTLTSGTLADGGKTITVSGTGTLSNSATHSGSGSITYSSTTPTIGGTGGTFGNLFINTNATIATSGPQTVTGTLRLVNANSTLNIGSNALTVLGNIFSNASPGTAVAFDQNKRIQTIGFHNAGGLTRAATANTALLFPVGTGAVYTPNTITVNLATSYGTITVRPVNSEHPNVTTSGTSVLYYWRVTSSGFVTTASTTVLHSGYDFSSATKNGTAANYRAARYDRSTNTWAAYGTNTAMTTAILPSPFNTGDVAGSTHWPAGLGDRLDGEYTCGNIGAFGAVTAYYSKGNGLWNAPTGVWTSSSTHSGADLAGPPCTTCPVIIGDGAAINHSITVDTHNRSCGTLAINTGSTLDCDRYTGLNFGTTAGGAVTGGGLLRIGSPNYPSGDFTNFIGSNGGTVEWYLASATGLGLTGTLAATPSALVVPAGTYTNILQASSSGAGVGARFTVVMAAGNVITSVTATQAGSGYANGNTVTINGSSMGGSGTMSCAIAAGNISYIIPATGPSPQNLSLATYYNLILNPASTFTINLPPTNLTVFSNWTQQTGTGTVTNNGARTLAITGNLTVSAGTFSLTNSGNTTMTVGGNVSNSGTFSTSTGTHTLSVIGGITNNGTLNFNNTGTVALTFTGSSNVTFGGTGTGGTTLSRVTLNKGTSQTPTVDFSVGGTVTSTAVASGWLTLTNGTFNFNNSQTYTISSNLYTIPSSAKLKVNAGTVNITTTSNDANDLFLNGALEVSGGTVNVGNTTDDGNNSDIEYGAAGTPTITVSSGVLNVKSSIRRSALSLAGGLVYNQTGGTVTVSGIDSNTTRGVFEIDANGSSNFTLTGNGTLNVQRQTGGTGYADLFINPITSNVASTSTIAVGLTGGVQNNFRVNIAPSIGTFTVVGTSAQTVNLFSNPMILSGNLNINTPSVLITNSLDVTVAGDMTISGPGGVYTGGTNTTTFNGTGPQAASLTSGSTFNNLTVSKTAGTTLTLSGTAPNLNNLNILSGILSVGSALQVSADITNNSSQVGAGSIVIFGAATTHNIYSTNGIFTNLTLGGVASSKIVNVTGNMTINGTLTFSTANRYLMIKTHQLTLGNVASVTGAGATAFIRTNGVSSDLGVTKIFPVGAASFTYPIGALFSYTPVTYSLNTAAGGSGPLTVVPVNSRHLTSISGEQLLNYYWIVTRGAALNTTVTANHTYTYLASLMGGAGGTLAAGYLDISNPTGWITTAHGGTAVTPVMTFATTPTTNFPAAGNTYHYSVGTSASLPNPLVPVYSRLNGLNVTNLAIGGNWSAVTSWTTDPDGTGPAVSSAPSGQAVVILPTARINTNLTGRKAFVTTINGLLVIGNTGHSMGAISGTGTMRVSTNTFPAGTYTNFVSAAGGTIEYVAPMPMSGRDTYNNLSIYSGSTGLVTMPATPVPMTVNGNVTIPVNTTLGPNATNNTNMNVAGNWNNAGTFIGGSLVAPSNFSVAGILNNSGTFTLGTTTNFSLASDLNNSGTFNQTAGTVAFIGSAPQSITGVTTFFNLTINKPTNNLTLTTTTNVNGILTLSGGNIISNDYPAVPLLVLGSAATLGVGGGSAASFVSGQIRKTMNGAATFTFPVGSNSPSRYRPVGISAASATDTWNVSYIPHNPTTDLFPNTSFNSANLAEVSQHEYWQVANGGVASAGLTLSFGPGSYTSGGDAGILTSLRTARWTGSMWDLPPGTGDVIGAGTFSWTGDNLIGTVSFSPQTAFSPQTLASLDINSALPIELVSFKGVVVENAVLLNWETASELNNDFFTVERSAGGEVFSSIGKVNGGGTSSRGALYSLVDHNPIYGTGYYRLKQTDFDGTFTYSKVIAITFEGSTVPTMDIYPNPSDGEEFNIIISGLKNMETLPVVMYDQLGRECMRLTLIVDESSGTASKAFSLEKALPQGMYLLKAGPSLTLTKRFVVGSK